MKHVIPSKSILTLLLAGFLAWGTADESSAQFTIAEDEAANYSGWTNGSNEGFGFGEWSITSGDGTGSAGAFTGDPGDADISGLGDPSFALFANPDGSGAFVNADRSLQQPLSVGQTLQFDWGVNWDSDGSGNKGFNLYVGGTGGDQVINVNMGGSATITINGDPMFENYGTQAMTIHIERTSETELRIHATGRDGSESYDQTFTLTSSAVDAFRFYASDLASGDNRQPYFNNFLVTASEVSVALDGAEGYRLLSAPAEVTMSALLDPIWTQGATSGGNSSEGSPNVYTWNADAAGNDATNWNPLADLTQNTSPGTGFLVYVFEDDDPGVEGVSGGFPKTLAVTGSEPAEAVTPDINSNADGWSLAGNPFAAPIRFAQLDKTNLTDVVYVWDVNDGGGASGGSDVGAGSWQSYSEGAGTGDLVDGVIAPFQGFFVHSAGTGGSLTIPLDARGNGGEFMGKQQPDNRIRLELTGEGMRNSAWLVFGQGGSMEQAYGDAHQLMPLSSDYALIASEKAGDLFDIGMMPLPSTTADKSLEIPLHVEASLPGTYTITATDVDVAFAESLFLEDRSLGIVKPISPSFSYEFTIETGAVARRTVSPTALSGGELAKAEAGTATERFYVTAGSVADAGEGGPALPHRTTLSQNYPNPFNPVTVIRYELAESGPVSLTVYDLLGRRVSTLVSETRQAGRHQVSFDATGLSSGIYMYRLEAGGVILTRQMTVVK
ncbi:T9SS type A sorting domain-containing protein [Balneolales bacterium ANBcel1]|nr:T9SS type A sorting domain-containing protein [Balneolales bacterium ANBcel1]